MLRKFALCLLVLCVPAAAHAQIARISPSSMFVGPAEDFLTIFGQNLVGSESTTVRFSGPAGVFNLEPSASSIDGTQLVVWIPAPVAVAEGRHTIEVFARDLNVVAPRQYGPVNFDVVQQVFTGPPLLGIPEVVLATAQNASGATVTYSVNGLSQGGTGLSIQCTPPSGSQFALGTTNVTCTATDSIGSTSGTFLVVVADTTGPVFTTLPADISTTNPVVTFVVAATDAIDGTNVTIACNPASGSTFPVGVTQVLCTANDRSLNPTFASFKVTVSSGTPVLTLPADITAEATSPAGAVVTYTASSNDGSPVTCSRPSGSTFPLGATTVNCSATNTAGTSSGSFRVTVVDTTAPIVTITASPASLWPPDHKMVNVTLSVIASDAVDSTPVSTIVAVASNQPVDGTGDGDTAPDWVVTGPLTLQLRAERAGNVDRIYTIFVQTMDDSGNGVMTQVQVKVTQQNRGRAVR